MSSSSTLAPVRHFANDQVDVIQNGDTILSQFPHGPGGQSVPEEPRRLPDLASRYLMKLTLRSAFEMNVTSMVSLLCKFWHLLKTHSLAYPLFAVVSGHLMQHGLKLSQGNIMDATIIATPPSTKSKGNARDPDMHQTKKGQQWFRRPPLLSSTAVWSPIPQLKEIGREEAVYRRTDHRLPARG